ncbi:PREDICTED: F-box/LRR-repeat protein At3g58980-like [Camelina sativa]|uniref:F-box/LRR-repeat protein At3g58980-like n=1 Tax=Camelina sativa TaxID=90675 RepID=A0ABM0SKZ9_CAMSA|nr:PREDICTED: F-box/LRR-repeat protein At3g58980-like [Camelina sativa]
MDLQLSIYGENVYALPLEVFTCKTVIKMKLGTDFGIDFLPKNAWLPALETLCLDSIRFYDLHDCAFQALLFASPELKELIIDVKLNLRLVPNPQWDGLYPDDEDVYSSNPANLIKGIRHVKILELSSSFSFEALNFFHRSFPLYECLNLLILNHVDVEFCWQFLPFLLKKAPNLKTLIIKGGLHCGEEPDYGYVCRCLSNYSCLPSSNIEVLKINLAEGGTVAELEQLKNFLGKLTSLQLLQVGSWKKLRKEFMSDLLKLPRASSKCKIQQTRLQ